MRIKRRRVRLHLNNDLPSIEGILVGNVDGHYLLKVARLVKSADETISLEGDVEVPRRQVIFLQRIGEQ